MIRLVLLLLGLATPALSQTARVLSGEHGDFTRLVVELPDGGAWTVGRTADGYAFAAESEDQPAYDLSAVWQRIDRGRLGEVTTDPVSGVLRLQLACACHVFPFEYRQGVIVLDIRPGPAPDGSAFEAAFVQPGIGPTAAESTAKAGGYDWLDFGPTVAAGRVPADLPLPLDTGQVSLEPLRDALLEQIALGAADGLVDMKLPGKPGKVAPQDRGALPWSRIRIGEMPGVTVLDPDAFVEAGRPMADCTPDKFLDLAAWGEGKPPAVLLADSRSGLFGEFDVPDPDAVLRSVRQLLHLGFGAEALQTAAFLTGSTAEGELAVYRSLARIIDGDGDPQTPFAAMLDCNGSAALWAALARDRLPFGPGVNRDAILRAFVALPPHLRRQLGPALAEKFLALADADAARMIRDAIERAPEADAATVALMDANAELQAGDAAAAIAYAEQAVALEGDSVDGLVTLVEAHFRTLDRIGAEVPEALQALQGEMPGTGAGTEIGRALVLALALSGQTEAAFGQEAASGAVLGDLWRVAVDRATDDDFLRRAVLPRDARRPEVAPDVGLGIARRLLALGFADAALPWVAPVGPGDNEDMRLVAASAELGRGDARASLNLLAGISGPEAEELRARALVQMGDLPAAAAALSAAGKTEEAARLALWEGDWSSPVPEAAAPWRDAATHVPPTAQADGSGLLARGGAVAAQSENARAAVEALLGAVPSPSGG